MADTARGWRWGENVWAFFDGKGMLWSPRLWFPSCKAWKIQFVSLPCGEFCPCLLRQRFPFRHLFNNRSISLNKLSVRLMSSRHGLSKQSFCCRFSCWWCFSCRYFMERLLNKVSARKHEPSQAKRISWFPWSGQIARYHGGRRLHALLEKSSILFLISIVYDGELFGLWTTGVRSWTPILELSSWVDASAEDLEVAADDDVLFEIRLIRLSNFGRAISVLKSRFDRCLDVFDLDFDDTVTSIE